MHDPARHARRNQFTAHAAPRPVTGTTSPATWRALVGAVLVCLFASSAAWQAAAARQAAGDKPAADKPANPPQGDAEQQGIAADAPPTRTYDNAVVIRFEGVITTMLEQYFCRKLNAAEKQGADLVVVEIESPGGDADASFRIAETLRDVKWARTVAFIPKAAYSGAAVVAIGCDEILMVPTGQLGDVGVIFADVEEMTMKYVPEKYLSAYVRRFRDLAEAKGRSPALVEAMMDRNAEVHQYRNTRTGEERYMTAADAKQAGAEWTQGAFVAESAKDRFLTVGGKRALELKLAEGLIDDRGAVLKLYGVEKPPTVMEWTAVDTTVSVLNNSWITALLLIVGLVCLYIEFSAPGIGIGGLMAGLCFVLFFWSRFFGGTAEWLEVILFLAGLAFLGVELFVLPGFGVVGLTGLLLMVASVVLASQSFLIPHTAEEMRELRTNLLVVAGSGVGFFAAAVFVSKYFGMIPVLSALRLEPPKPSASPATDATPTGDLPLTIGATGEAHTALRPGGKAKIDGRLVDVVAEGTFIDRGRAVEVVEIAGTRVVVREA